MIHINRVLRFIVLIIFALHFFSCQTTDAFYSMHEIKKKSGDYDSKLIKPLINAAKSPNRNIASAAIEQLGMYLDVFFKEPTKFSKKISDVTAFRHVETIQDEIAKIYALNNDFNIQCLCLHAMSRYPSIKSYRFFTETLKQNHEITYELAAKYLTDYPAPDHTASPGNKKISVTTPPDNHREIISIIQKTLENGNTKQILYTLPLIDEFLKIDNENKTILTESIKSFNQISDNMMLIQTFKNLLNRRDISYNDS